MFKYKFIRLINRIENWFFYLKFSFRMKKISKNFYVCRNLSLDN